MLRVYTVSLLFCTLICTAVTVKDELLQLPRRMVITEEGIVTMNCTSAGVMSTVHWYRQLPNQPPQHLLMATRQTDQHRRITATIGGDNKLSLLTVRDMQLTDTAAYLCAVRHSVTNIWTARTETCAEYEPPLCCVWGIGVVSGAVIIIRAGGLCPKSRKYIIEKDLKRIRNEERCKQ